MNRRRFLVIAAVAGVAATAGKAAAASGPAPAHTTVHTTPATPTAAAKAIAYAGAQAGKGYTWGGTGPGTFDCSGLVMMAYRSAGVTIPRTSEEQWAQLAHVSDPQPGDLVFFPGSDGSWAQPGHVGLVTRPGWMIQAYAPGTPIGPYRYGTPGALEGTGPGTVIGFARPRTGA